MSKDLSTLSTLTTAEDYFQFFELPFDVQIVNVNRLHILRKFSQLVMEIDDHSAELTADQKYDQYRQALQNAYNLFTTSSSYEQKLFKVFQQKPANVVMLGDIGNQ